MTAIKRLIPNLLTAGNLVGGIFAIIFTLTGKIGYAPYCIFLSAIFDFLDGFAARLLKVQSELGKQLDSLADMVTFGVAPGLIVFSLMDYELARNTINKLVNHTDIILYNTTDVFKHDLSLNFTEAISYFAFTIPVFALFRLAKFNLDTRQTSSFIGLPTPAMTLFFAVLPVLIFDGIVDGSEWQKNLVYLFVNPIFLGISSIIMSILMVVELPLFALKFKHFKWGGNEVRYLFLTISLVLFATLLFWSVPLIIILYIILSIINNALKRKNEV